jgi:hypothetical protein
MSGSFHMYALSNVELKLCCSNIIINELTFQFRRRLSCNAQLLVGHKRLYQMITCRCSLPRNVV